MVSLSPLDKLTVTMIWRLFGFAGFVRVSQHMSNIRGQEVVHLVAEACLEHQLGVGGRVAHGQVEERRSTDPVNDVTEGKCGQQVLRK